MILLERTFYRRALLICKVFIGLLILELITFSLFKFSDLYLFSGPVFLVLADTLINKINKKMIVWGSILCFIYMASILTPLGKNHIYTVVFPGVSLIGCSVWFFIHPTYKYIINEFKFWLKYTAWFNVLVGLSAFLFLFNELKIQRIKINTFFFAIGLTIFTIVYVLMLLRALKKLQKDNQYQNNLTLLSEEYKDKIQALEMYFIENREFLDPDFTIDELTEPLLMDKKDLSFLLNHVLKTNFYTLLAEKRIRVAEQLIVKSYDVYTIEYIMLQAGFRSKSSFNRYFKQYTGKTPSEFRDAIILKKD